MGPALRLLSTLGALLGLAACGSLPSDSGGALHQVDRGTSVYGAWSVDTDITPGHWVAGGSLTLHVTLRLADGLLSQLALSGKSPDAVVMLVTAERTFDAGGVLRLPSDERMSTLLTPTGLAIEGGVQGAVTKRFGYGFRTPVDELASRPADALLSSGTDRVAVFDVSTRLPDDLPPGIYRLRFDFGVEVKKRLFSLNGEAFARRGFLKDPCELESYSPPIPASGRHADGHVVDGHAVHPRISWVLLDNYNANGYHGVVADEDRRHFALSGRNIMQDDVILPRFDENNPNSPLAYTLEPRFPTDTIFDRQNIPMDPTAGELAIKVTGPDGTTTDLGKASFVGLAGAGRPPAIRVSPNGGRRPTDATRSRRRAGPRTSGGTVMTVAAPTASGSPNA